MKLRSVEIENFRAIKQLKLSLDESLTVFHGDNAHGKTSVLAAIAAALGAIPTLLPEVTGTKFRDADRRRSARSVRVVLETTDGIEWAMRRGGTRSPNSGRSLRAEIKNIIEADEEGRDVDLPIVAFYDTDRAVFDAPQRRTPKEFPRYAALEGALSVRSNFGDFFKWFYAKEDEELRAQRRQSSFVSRELQAVRTAITSMIPGVPAALHGGAGSTRPEGPSKSRNYPSRSCRSDSCLGLLSAMQRLCQHLRPGGAGA